MRNFEEELYRKINALEVKVDESNLKYTAVEINTHCDHMEKLSTEMFDTTLDIVDRKASAKLWRASGETTIGEDLAGYRNQLLQIEMLEESLKLNLFEVTTRYLITDDKELISPAGYHYSDRVFVQPTNIAIQSNSIKNVPSCNVDLRAFDMDNIE
tara:strand:- start:2271 stop:2738 length:468 start_codon:yes stop_codon:yes gene_type:complete